jgi:hypothetical protein
MLLLIEEKITDYIIIVKRKQKERAELTTLPLKID